MKTRNMKFSDYGISEQDEEKLKDLLSSLTAELRKELFLCAIESAPGYEFSVYESIVNGIGYFKLLRQDREMPNSADDFYAYRRKTLAIFYHHTREKGVDTLR